MPITPVPDRRLRCSRCGCVLVLTPDEMLRIGREEPWPRCCVLPMVLVIDEQPVNPRGETDLERPHRPAKKLFRD